jgi:hypothetical protein
MHAWVPTEYEKKKTHTQQKQQEADGNNQGCNQRKRQVVVVWPLAPSENIQRLKKSNLSRESNGKAV